MRRGGGQPVGSHGAGAPAGPMMINSAVIRDRLIPDYALLHPGYQPATSFCPLMWNVRIKLEGSSAIEPCQVGAELIAIARRGDFPAAFSGVLAGARTSAL